MPKGARSNRVSGAMLEVLAKNQHSGLGGFAWEHGPDVFRFDGRRQARSSEPFIACRSFWMPKRALSDRFSRAMNGTVLEVSGKNCHSGLGGFAWEQGPDVFNFDGRRRAMASEPLRCMSEFLDA